jgi:hypothetical protein
MLVGAAGDLVVRFGVAALDAYLEFLAVRSRPNTVAAVAYDLKVFFTVVGKPPRRVVAADVRAFVTAQYAGGPARCGRRQRREPSPRRNPTPPRRPAALTPRRPRGYSRALLGARAQSGRQPPAHCWG